MIIAPNGDALPRLLVSVRSVAEARAALDGGCDLLDIKEPRNGPLGMAEAGTIQQIAAMVDEYASRVPVSAALGEVSEWIENPSVPGLSNRLAYAKLGTAGLRRLPDWQSRWQQVRQHFERASDATLGRFNEPTSAASRGLAESEKQNSHATDSAGRFGWIAVAYADWQAADAPPVEDVLHAVLSPSSGWSRVCRGVLLDTFAKAGRSRLLDWFSIAELVRFADTIHQAGLGFALAGSLRATDLARLVEASPDIIAIRSAACLGRRRLAAVSAAAVRSFKNSIRASWHPIPNLRIVGS